MGRKVRRTRWRTLDIDTAGGQQSDSDESAGRGVANKNGYNQQLAKSKQPAAKTLPQEQHTASNAKITFNEDEYTRITTPRQDVLFKKGYLSKPKTYQTQTSTGTSTISTGNSTTGNGTPDHQSADGTEGTDLEYESQQFVFPNGFVDQHGIYYINSYEPYPSLVVYNPPICYPPEFATAPRLKRLSTGSLTESTSPLNEEASQEVSHSGGETVSTYPEYMAGGGGGVYNVVYPGYFYGNGVPLDIELSHGELRKIKKRRRRKLCKPVQEDDWSTSSSDDGDYDESEEMVSEIENRIIQGTHRPPAIDSPPTPKDSPKKKQQNDDVDEEEVIEDEDDNEEQESSKTKSGALKPDAKEFVPRSYMQHHSRQHHHHHRAHPQFIPSLIPLPSFLPAPHPHAVTALTLHPIDVAALQLTPAHPIEPETMSPAAVISATTVNSPSHPRIECDQQPETSAAAAKAVDIAKIISKLEEAASMQKQPKRSGINKTSTTSSSTIRSNRIDKSTNTSTTSAKNYSQIVRIKNNHLRNQQQPNLPAAASPQRVGKKSKAIEAIVTPNAVAVRSPPKTPSNQWIAVHSRKKRKTANKGAEELPPDASSGLEEVNNTPQSPEVLQPKVETVATAADDGFEVYDVTKLEDVIIVREEEPPQEQKQDKLPEMTHDDPVKTNGDDEEFDRLIKTLEELEAKQPKSRVRSSRRVMVTDVPKEAVKAVEVQQKVTPKPAESSKPPAAAVEEVLSIVATPERKVKKKKKKQNLQQPLLAKKQLTNDDSFNFLLTDAKDERTNVEMSAELDKIIQRGMYNSLEEKIRAMNITAAADDGFFSSLTAAADRERCKPKEAADLGEVVTKTTNIFKAKRTGTQQPDIEQELRRYAQPSYPITQAVKNWMARTRETTPDVELLKSPQTIWKTLNCRQESDVETTPSPQMDVKESWSVTPASSFEGDDLLDCWDDEGASAKQEEALEVYESLYGKSDDFQKVRADVEERRRNGTLPKHGQLPFRAICCSVM